MSFEQFHLAPPIYESPSTTVNTGTFFFNAALIGTVTLKSGRNHQIKCRRGGHNRESRARRLHKNVRKVKEERKAAERRGVARGAGPSREHFIDMHCVVLKGSTCVCAPHAESPANARLNAFIPDAPHYLNGI